MSGLSLDDFVALNALIVTAMGLSFVGLGRRQRGRPLLNLKLKSQKFPQSPQQAASLRSNSSYGAAALRRLEQEEFDSDSPLPELRAIGNSAGQVSGQVIGATRELNVFFNWNGHTWEAYEVLGVPPGSGRESVVGAFHESRAKSPDSTAFFQAAADAILKVQS